MGLNLANYQNKTESAVKFFWSTRTSAKKKQRKREGIDRGERSAVTAGKNMDGFLQLMKDIVELNGLKHADICLERRILTLPGFFRPTKIWDMLVLNQGKLIAALEFKSQVGPSFGNNFNNRVEESLGTALDLWTAFREGAFGESPKPFLGWLILVEDCDTSRSPTREKTPHFPTIAGFDNASYIERYHIFCRKLMQEGLYSSASVLLSKRESVVDGRYTELSDMTGMKNFVTTLAGHIASEAAREE